MNDGDEPPLLHAFAGYGIEIEYMIVDRDSLSVLPIADRVLHAAPGSEGNDVRRGGMGWSNELVLHVIEVKNLRPTASLGALPQAFQAEVREIGRMLEPHGACLMPGGMHPWMNPRDETRLWTYGNEAIYRAYNRIFDARRHGWANLQSMHINLPFGDDLEFERLHAAIRLVLPILPALASSSPIADACETGWADYRMCVYCDNAQQFPSIAGLVVPENVTTRAAYEQCILAPMYLEIAPYDPDKVLQYEWLNSRGAIARFDRNAIEIRVVDTQECPLADIAVATAVIAAVHKLYDDAKDLVAQQEMTTASLASLLRVCMRDGEQAQIDNAAYLRLFGFPWTHCTAGELWRYLVDRMAVEDALQWRDPLEIILSQGPLAKRILRAVGEDFSRARLQAVYRALCNCLQEGRMFVKLS